MMTTSKYRVAYPYPNGTLGIVRASGNRNTPPTNVTVRTWADGFGTWHAEFTTTGNQGWDVAIARTAIRYELDSRRLVTPDSKPLTIHVTRQDRRSDRRPDTHYVETA